MQDDDDYGDDAPNSLDDPSTPLKRNSRACDHCRKTRSRCTQPSKGERCIKCVQSDLTCITTGPTRKRGPLKGYIYAADARLRETEALLGILLSSGDTSVRNVLSKLRGDATANSIIDRVDAGIFGPRGSQDSATGSSSSRNHGNETYHVATLTGWQERLIASLNQENQEGISSNSTTLLHTRGRVGATPIEITPRGLSGSPEVASSSSSVVTNDLALESGQFTVDVQNQLHYEGRASGLALLSKSQRVDHSNQGGLWKDIYTAAEEPSQSETDMAKLPLIGGSIFPPIDVQDQLLDVYFLCIHPMFPVLSQMQMWKQYRNRDYFYPSMQPFDLLLLVMFSLAAHMIPSETVAKATLGPVIPNAESHYFEHAKSSFESMYKLSHPTVCVSLLLMGYREFGMGNVPQAWLFTGMAIRMAQDLGVHKSSDEWTSVNGPPLFTDDQKNVRKRLWYGCVLMDRCFGMYLGRPLAIRDYDWDVQLLNDVTGHPEENLIWKFHPTHDCPPFYTPVSARLISCINANVSLSALIGKIIERLYPAKGARGLCPPTDLIKEIHDWRERISLHLRVIDENTMLKAPPTILGLHMRYWCAVILLFRPFLPTSEHNDVESDGETCSAWEQCLTAAQQLVEIAQTWRINFHFKHPSPFFVYDVFQAGLMWVAAVTFRPMEPHFLSNLEFCLEALNEMRILHPLAIRCYELLQGTVASQQIFPPGTLPIVEENSLDLVGYARPSGVDGFPFLGAPPVWGDCLDLGGVMEDNHEHRDYFREWVSQ